MPDLAGSLHDRYVAPRRVRILANLVAPLLPENARVLDVGCGDGAVSRAIQQLRPDLHIEGVEVLLRDRSEIPVAAYDGKNLPFPDQSFDCVVMVDVLHHENDPARLLREAARVTSQCVVVKDHLLEGLLAAPTLRFMDWVGNARHGVALPYRYWRRAEWQLEIERAGLAPVTWDESLRLYPWPASLVFDRELHFVSRLEKRQME
ncbi:MAG TPA: class I SAM-dependent methyltransferase [Terriglobales bacterium]|jgi:SAM-dependent methyltransferase|nr:class I SAM-dependent methyltransferase [Terriglobales bacterium]